MIVAVDASVLVYLIDENARPPTSTATGSPVDRCVERVEHLISTLTAENAKIVVPTPALAEVLVRVNEKAPELIAILQRSSCFRIAPFDERAAVEHATTQAARALQGKKGPAATRAKAKFDDQIVAVAAVEQATVIYSDDEDIKKLAGSRMQVIGIEGLPLPPESPQAELFRQIDTSSAGPEGVSGYTEGR